MQVTFKVYRFRGEGNGQPFYQSYTLDVAPETSVFDALLQIREEQDGSLAFRGTCHRGFCGDCSLRVNRRGIISCMVPVKKVVQDGEVTVEPVRNVRILKDLIYDTDLLLWDKYKATHPWLRPREDWPQTIDDGALAKVRVAMRCTMCSFCDEGCTVIDVDKDFLGPAALTKVYRFVFDPRDGAARERLQEVSEPKGLWDCVHCFEANEHCPKAIDPTYRILDLRDRAIRLGIKAGKNNPKVARHYDSFAASVRATGWLDERKLAMDSEGLGGMISLLSTGIKAFRRGKAPLRHPKRPGAEDIARIFQKYEEEIRAEQK